MSVRHAHAIYTGTTAIAAFLLSFLCVSMLRGQMDTLTIVTIVLVAAVTYCAGFACRHILTN